MQFLALLLIAVLSFGAEMESGVVVRSDTNALFLNTIPQIATLSDGRLFVVWGAGVKSQPNRHVYGTFSSDSGKTWSKPVVLIKDSEKNDADPNLLIDGSSIRVYSTRVRIPNDIRKAWTFMVRSYDNGATWSAPTEIFIPRQYTPGKQHNAIKLRDGSYAMGIAWDHWAERGLAARSEGEMDLSSGILLSTDGEHWTLHGSLHAYYENKVAPGHTNGLCEPSIVELHNGELLMILRSGGPRHYESRSLDGGLTWSVPKPSSLTGSNTPTALWRNQKNPAEIIAVWNSNPLHRWPLVAALSKDGGRSWTPAKTLANPGRQVSYPGITQLPNGELVAVWQEALETQGRDIRYAKFTVDWLTR